MSWRAKVRNFVEKELKPHVSEWEAQESVPVKEICKKMVREGLYGQSYPKELGSTRFEGYDEFHSLIFGDEMARLGAGGVSTSLLVGIGIGLGPVVVGLIFWVVHFLFFSEQRSETRNQRKSCSSNTQCRQVYLSCHYRAKCWKVNFLFLYL